ncbi:MAG: hypothetical protein IPF99_34700 [Deltaproteobacteria bacterium]|nr:hypothetical protein [Deltaproteobacteria bacterium]
MGAVPRGRRGVHVVGAVHSRFSAVHNTMVSLGMNQLGHLSEGSLFEGGTVNLPVELEAQCYTFVAFGGEGSRDVDLSLLDASNNRVAGDATRDAQAAVRWCARARGRGGGHHRDVHQPAPAAAGPVGVGQHRGAPVQHTGQCLRGEGGGPDDDEEGARAGAPEVVYAFTLDRRQQVNIALETTGSFDGALYLRAGNCEAASAEVACNDDEGDTNHSRVVQALDPGSISSSSTASAAAAELHPTLNAQDVPSGGRGLPERDAPRGQHPRHGPAHGAGLQRLHGPLRQQRARRRAGVPPGGAAGVAAPAPRGERLRRGDLLPPGVRRPRHRGGVQRRRGGHAARAHQRGGARGDVLRVQRLVPPGHRRQLHHRGRPRAGRRRQHARRHLRRRRPPGARDARRGQHLPGPRRRAVALRLGGRRLRRGLPAQPRDALAGEALAGGATSATRGPSP